MKAGRGCGAAGGYDWRTHDHTNRSTANLPDTEAEILVPVLREAEHESSAVRREVDHRVPQLLGGAEMKLCTSCHKEPRQEKHDYCLSCARKRSFDERRAVRRMRINAEWYRPVEKSKV